MTMETAQIDSPSRSDTALATRRMGRRAVSPGGDGV